MENAVDREKVIKGLECCMVGDGHSLKCELCPYATVGDDTCQTMDGLFADALALLKAQEPRVLSVADIIDVGITPDIIWIERRKEDDVAAGVWQIDHYEMVDGGVVDDLGEEIAEAPEAYNTKWRCWTARPTDEQREAVKWDEAD